jgi:DtxR family Mn-dependent transcriptional regulator
MSTNTTENYLKALFNLSLHNSEIYMADIARNMGVSLPTVNSMIKKLHEKKLIRYSKYKPIKLTPKGKKEAALIVRKHRLIEMFLVKFMRLGWEHVHEIAEEMEHIKSVIFFEKLEEMLGNPKTDPHGSPIPDKAGNIEKLNLIPLSDCKKNDVITVKGLADTTSEFITFLNNKQIALGTKIKIVDIEPFDNTMMIKYNQKTTSLSVKACSKILVLTI